MTGLTEPPAPVREHDREEEAAMAGSHASDTLSAQVARADAAFDAALDAAPDAHLWFLHASLEKQQNARVIRGSWGGAGGVTCPLAALVLGAAPATDEEAREVAIQSEDLLRARGMHARDFTAVWDAGLIPAWRLLRRVDAEITRRLLDRRTRRR